MGSSNSLTQHLGDKSVFQSLTQKVTELEPSKSWMRRRTKVLLGDIISEKQTHPAECHRMERDNWIQTDPLRQHFQLECILINYSNF